MENSIESLIAAQIQRTSEKCENPYILSTDLAMLNDSIANMTNALANYLAIILMLVVYVVLEVYYRK